MATKRTMICSGAQFGYLTVIERAPSPEQHPRKELWRCKCVCGNECILPTRSLTQKKTTSCGCRRQPSADYTGLRFYHLVGVRPTEKRKNTAVVWIWQCDCGKQIEALPKLVVAGSRRSCGCMTKEGRTKSAMHALEANPIVDGTNLACIASKKVYKNSSSGIRGVYWSKRKRKWAASISLQGKRIFLGYFINLDDAATARKEAEEKYFAPVLEKHKDLLKAKKKVGEDST